MSGFLAWLSNSLVFWSTWALGRLRPPCPRFHSCHGILSPSRSSTGTRLSGHTEIRMDSDVLETEEENGENDTYLLFIPPEFLKLPVRRSRNFCLRSGPFPARSQCSWGVTARASQSLVLQERSPGTRAGQGLCLSHRASTQTFPVADILLLRCELCQHYLGGNFL